MASSPMRAPQLIVTLEDIQVPQVPKLKNHAMIYFPGIELELERSHSEQENQEAIHIQSNTRWLIDLRIVFDMPVTALPI